MVRNLDHLVQQFLEKEGFKYSTSDKPGFEFRLKVQGENGQWETHLSAQNDYIESDSILEHAAPRERNLKVAELFTLANYGMSAGAFRLDLSDGEVGYHVGVNVMDLESDIPGIIENVFYLNWLFTDRYLPPIMAVCHTEVSPMDALLTAGIVIPSGRDFSNDQMHVGILSPGAVSDITSRRMVDNLDAFR
jgi:hypothetical protein